MALYRRGTASMDADGTIHGTDTKWKDQLSLIRVGATIVFLEQPIKLAVISDIVSDTEMKAISTDGQTAADGKYVILLNDSLTVNGLAQNVAETLRYYQSIKIPETNDDGAVEIGYGGTGATTAAEARANLGLGGVSTENIVPVAKGGTGATTAAEARANLGLGGVSTENIVPVAKGGTGSDNAGGARINLGLNRFYQEAGETRVIAPDNKSYLTVSNSMWGVFDMTDGVWRPLAIAQGGTGATTSDGARANLGLGSVSTENIVPIAKGGTGATTADGVRGTLRISQQTGEYGSINNILTIFNNALPSGGLVSFRDNAVDATSVYRYSASLLTRTLDTYATFSVNHANGNLRVSSGVVSGGIATTNYINDIWGTRNTTVDSSGFIKKASPIVKIFEDGTFDANIEANGVTVTRLSEGVYKITGCLGLNSDASWGGPDGGFEIPLDKNKQARIWIDYSVDADGSIEVRTYHREHPNAPVFAQNKIDGYDNGKPIDIPKGVFVSVRVNMP